MSRRALGVAMLGVLVVLGGCYHATVTTGAPPSDEVIRKGFASGWVFGLVPPSTVETASQCASGVAQVETQLSFVNQLVGMLTLGIYTPMEIKVTCAAAASASAGGEAEVLHVSASAPTDVIRSVLGAAAAASQAAGEPVLVVME